MLQDSLRILQDYQLAVNAQSAVFALEVKKWSALSGHLLLPLVRHSVLQVRQGLNALRQLPPYVERVLSLHLGQSHVSRVVWDLTQRKAQEFAETAPLVATVSRDVSISAQKATGPISDPPPVRSAEPVTHALPQRRRNAPMAAIQMKRLHPALSAKQALHVRAVLRLHAHLDLTPTPHLQSALHVPQDITAGILRKRR